MEVLVLNDYAAINGGSTAVALSSACGLAAAGIPVTLFAPVGPVEPGLRDVPGLKVVCLHQQEIAVDPNRARAFIGGIWNRTAVRTLIGLLAQHDPRSTIVHVHTWTKSLSPFALHAAIRRGFKVVVTLHDYFIACPTGGFFLPKTGELCELQPLSSACLKCSCDRRHYAHKLWRSARTWIQNRVLRVPEGITHYIGISNLSVALIRRWLPPESQITIVRNPIECRDEGPTSVASNAPLLFIGRFSLEKGILLAAEAVHRTQVPAVFIGDGELMDKARALCPHATFTGWLSGEEVRSWRRKARALLFPPIWHETLGLVVVEAASDGVPAIVSDRCAAADFVAAGERGLHFQHGSVDSLCEQIGKLKDDVLTARLGQQAYDWFWASPWSLANHVAELRSVYDRVLAGETIRTRPPAIIVARSTAS